MNLMQAVAKVLWADATFRAACPGGIAAVLAPEGAPLPLTTYMIVGGPSDPTFDTPGLQQTRVEFNCYANSYVEASAAREALTAALLFYRGLLGDGKTFLQGALVISPMDFYDSDARQHRCMVEFYLYYTFL